MQFPLNRPEYISPPLRKTNLQRDPFVQLTQWIKEAEDANAPLPETMCLATIGLDGSPAARMVLLKGLQPEGLDFFTCLQSQKANQLSADPRACLDFWWSPLNRQVVVSGQVEPLRRKLVEKYFETRPRGSQIAATISRQSAPSPSRDDLEDRWQKMENQFEGEQIPCPDHWGGFRLVPERFEFWQGREDRLHDRFEFLPTEEAGLWDINRLDP